MRVFAGIVVVNVVLFAIAWAAYEYWPPEPESPYTCSTLDNGIDEVEVCIADDGIRYTNDCRELRRVIAEFGPP